ncbi:MAG: hypothetical protein M1840_008302 [Geoglossum simile]|nr:MAG: hypothetical protein M1840_008302 [Geoglossum simile]
MERDTGSSTSVMMERGDPKFHAGTATEGNMDYYINTVIGQKSPRFDAVAEEGDVDARVDAAAGQEKQLDAFISIDHPATQSIRNAMFHCIKKDNLLWGLPAMLEKGARKRTVGGAKKIKDTDETERPIEVGQSLKLKWRQFEKSDLKEVALMNREVVGETVPLPKVGQQSKYVEVLQKLAGQIIVKRVNNRPSPVTVGADGADNFLEIARAIAGPLSIIQLAYRVKHLITGEPKDPDSPVPQNLRADCYDQAGGLNKLGILVQHCIDIIPVESNDAASEIRHRHNCVQMAKLYEQEQLERRELRKSKASGLGKQGRGKGVASLVKKKIVSLIGCTTACFDRWIKLGKALTPFVDEFGLGILGIFPYSVSNFQILHLPINSLPLIVSAINDLYPSTKALSALVEEHLLEHLLDQSSPDPATLRSMLDQAKAMDLRTPFASIIGSMATADPDNQAPSPTTPGSARGTGDDKPSKSHQGRQTPTPPQTENGAPTRKRENGAVGGTASKKPKV